MLKIPSLSSEDQKEGLKRLMSSLHSSTKHLQIEANNFFSKGGRPLNEKDSVLIATPLLDQDRPQLKKLLKDGRLQCSDKLGDEIMDHKNPDVEMGISVYRRAECHWKVYMHYEAPSTESRLRD